MIKVGLFGFGRTGKLAAGEIIKDPQCRLEWVVRKSDENLGEYASRFVGFKEDQGIIFNKEQVLKDPDFFAHHPVDVIIDFSNHESIFEYERAADLNIKIISAISQYQKPELEKLQELSAKTAIVFSPNITLGINFLIVISSILKKIIPDADIEIVEEHFREKFEKSGTALKIARMLELDSAQHVNSIRVGGIIGKHEVIFGLPNQTIRVTHESINRAAFGRGAVFAAKWLIHKDKGLFSMEDIIKQEFIDKAQLI